MKTVLTLLCSLTIAFSARAQSAAVGTGSATVTPLAAAKEAEPPKIDGVEVARAGGGFLGVAINDGTFKISFYDAKKKPVTADVAQAVLRWDSKSKFGNERVVLNPSGDGKALTAARIIRPPYVFKLFITLLKDSNGGDAAAPAESYTIDFSA